MNRETPFFKRSEAVAKRFLQTAVVIDDRAFEPQDEASRPFEVAPPPTPSTFLVGETPVPRSGVAEPARHTPDAHSFDAQPVIDGFAKHGIVCAVLLRQKDDVLANISNRLSQLVDVVDILVVDWHIHVKGKESFTQTLDLLDALCSGDKDSKQEQLRLVAIYTGELNLGGVAEKIRERLAKIKGETIPDGDYAIRKGGTRIVVLGKKIAAGRAPNDKKQEVDFGNLGDRAISEFTEMTAGLVSNVAVASLAQIRSTTHRLLSRFGQELDAPFLAHRALVDPPSSANDQLLPLITAELESILEDTSSADLLADPAVIEWLNVRPNPMGSLNVSVINSEEKARQAIRDICLKGVKRHEDFAIKSQPPWVKKIEDNEIAHFGKLTDAVAGECAGDANERLEELMSLRTHYSSRPPVLSLGTILERSRWVKDAHEVRSLEKSFWICVQPSCDCFVRDSHTKRRYFPLLGVESVTAGKPYNMIARTKDAWIRLKCTAKPFRQQMVEFEANTNEGSVSSALIDNGYWFRSVDAEAKFKWIGQLKFPQAQRLAHSMGSEAGKVGLTESEWLRRTARR